MNIIGCSKCEYRQTISGKIQCAKESSAHEATFYKGEFNGFKALEGLGRMRRNFLFLSSTWNGCYTGKRKSD